MTGKPLSTPLTRVATLCHSTLKEPHCTLSLCLRLRVDVEAG